MKSDHLDVAINVPQAELVASGIQLSGLRPMANAFVTNARAVLGMLSLPEASMTRGMLFGYIFGKNNHRIPTVLTPAQANTWVDTLLAEFSQHANNGGLFEVFNQASESDFGRLLEEEQVAGYYRATLKGATASAWTMFECLARELFDEVKSICKGGSQRNNKLDGLDDMKSAYRWLVDGSQAIDAIFDAKELVHLEAARHVVVHNGGIINQQYLNRTGYKLQLNGPLPLDGKTVSKFTNDSIASGCNLLKWVDSHAAAWSSKKDDPVR